MRISLRFRVALAAGFAVTVACLLLSTTALLVIRGVIDRDIDQVLQERLTAAIVTVREDGVREARPDVGLDSDVWIVADGQVVASGNGSATVQQAAAELGKAPPGTANLEGFRLASQAARPGEAVVVGMNTKPYHRAQTLLTQVIAALDLLVIAVATVLAAILARTALRPVTEMTHQARQWSEQDVDRRFALGPAHDEITELAATLDSLMDRIAASMRYEQRFSAELAHELRTPLTTMLTEADIAMRHPEVDAAEALAVIRDQGERLREIVDTLMAAAAAEANPNTGRCTLAEVTEDLRADWDVEVVGFQDAGVGADREFVARILAPVLDNAARYALRRVWVETRAGDTVELHVHDDGPGVAYPDGVFEPGAKGADSTGAGLGLPLARRLASAAGGTVVVAPDQQGGHIIVRLPRT